LATDNRKRRAASASDRTCRGSRCSGRVTHDQRASTCRLLAWPRKRHGAHKLLFV